MTILLTGGGTGGHITPILAVAHELKKQSPGCKIVYVGEKNGKYVSMIADNPDIDEIHQISAGKFRRYHGESWLTRFLDIKTFLLNLRDLFRFAVGTLQAIILVNKVQPDIVFLKGGFVGLPIGLASAFWHRPFVTHDSDALPGIANRMVARWAVLHATAMPSEYYRYSKEKVRQVGVLVTEQYQHVTPEHLNQYRKELNLPKNAQVVMITGGSNGSKTINVDIAAGVLESLESNTNLYVIHQVGLGKSTVYEGISHERLQLHELLKDLHIYSGASDVIVTRAGANTIAEFGLQAKACIVVPNPLLTGGHQLLNAKYLSEKQAAIIVDESKLKTGQGSVLWPEITTLLSNKLLAEQLAHNLEATTMKGAAKELAVILLDAGNKSV